MSTESSSQGWVAGGLSAYEVTGEGRIGDAVATKKTVGRVHVRRQPSRGHYDRDSIYEVLDEGLVAHVAFMEAGQPFCIPMLQARIGDAVYLHGSTASRAMRILGGGAPACVTVTLLDGLVLARSAFEHSANYRSAVLLGSFSRVEDPDERIAAQELKATVILSMPIGEASAKCRFGPPSDDGSADAELDIWAGVVPMRTAFNDVEPSPGLRAGIPVPASARRLLERMR